MRWEVVGAVALLAGCSNPPPISNSPGGGVQSVLEASPIGKVFVQDMIDTAWNNNQAVAIGVLKADDPVVGCMNDGVTKLGFDPQTGAPLVGVAAPKEFTPRVVGVASLGSVAYIALQQLRSSGVGNTPDLTQACYAVIGKLIWNIGFTTARGAANTALGPLSGFVNALPGVGLGQAAGVLPKVP